MGHVQYIYRRVRPKTGKIPAEMKASSKLREYIYNFIALTYYEDTKYSYCVKTRCLRRPMLCLCYLSNANRLLFLLKFILKLHANLHSITISLHIF